MPVFGFAQEVLNGGMTGCGQWTRHGMRQSHARFTVCLWVWCFWRTACSSNPGRDPGVGAFRTGRRRGSSSYARVQSLTEHFGGIRLRRRFSFVFRADVTAHRILTKIGKQMLTGRIGMGYTFLSGRHLTETIMGPSNNVPNANASLRPGNVEIGVDAFNLLNLRYADDAEYYVSNWSMNSGTALASPATHLSQAPPLAVLGTVSLYF